MFMPSHVVDCDHTHDEDPEQQQKTSRANSHSQANGHGQLETTPLLSRPPDLEEAPRRVSRPEMREAPTPLEMGSYSRPSLQTRLTRKMTAIVSGEKDQCDHEGPCKGFTNPCGPECFRNINARGGTRASIPSRLSRSVSARPSLKHSASTSFKPAVERAAAGIHEDHNLDPRSISDPRQIFEQLAPSHTLNVPAARSPSPCSSHDATHDDHGHDHDHDHDDDPDSQPHHHHVPQNAFLSLSFQTSVAIVLHKLPEGFITFASNHANPDLGFNVFMALAIHNVTEGFALALPIYLATSSRWKALLYSSTLR